MPANRRGGGGGGRYYNQNNHGRNQNAQPPPMHPEVKPEAVQQSPRKEPEVKQEGAEQAGDAAKSVPPSEKKFTQRSRLFVGNLPINTSEQEFRDLFSKFGEISEIFVNSGKGFGFVRLDTRANAEKAKWELDGYQVKNRQLRVRFASHGAALSLKHLSPYVSNELLENAFQQFGPVERSVVIVDDRGRSTGRGIIEFARKSSATKALQQITEGCFLLTSSPQAIVAKPLDQEDTEDGLPEKNVTRNQQFFQEREAPPRFAQPGTFEYEFALRWKALDEMERQQQEQLDKSISSARQKLEAEMENAIHDHKTRMMKQDLMRRQEELRRLEEARQREMDRRKQMEMAREDAQKKEMEQLAKRQEILRAQVEGTFGGRGGGNQFEEPGYGNEGGAGFNQGNQGMYPPDLAHEMMAGGQGGLGPAPSRQARFEPGRGGNSPAGRGYGQGGGFAKQGFGNQRRNYGNPMDYEGAQKRRRF